MAHSAPEGRSLVRRVVIAVLLLATIGAALWVPFYARSMPKLGDFPFFYWYQLILVPAVAVVCLLCSMLAKAGPASGARHRQGGGLRR